MNAAVERALAELQAIPMRANSPQRDVEPSNCPLGCTGDRRGYQWHQRTGNLPACPTSHEAAVFYNREYLREWRKRYPNYRRNWLAQQKNGGESR